MKLLPLLFLIILALNSCVSRQEKLGYIFEISDIELLKEGLTSKEEVLHLMGSPSVVDDFAGDESWIYIAEDFQFYLFFKPKLIKRDVVILRFDDENRLTKIEKFDHNHELIDLKFVSDYTRVESKKVGFFKSLFSNVGQIRSQ